MSLNQHLAGAVALCLCLHAIIACQVGLFSSNNDILSSLAVVKGHPAVTFVENYNPLDINSYSSSLKYVRSLDANGFEWSSEKIRTLATMKHILDVALVIVNGKPSILSTYGIDSFNVDVVYHRSMDEEGINWFPPVTIDSLTTPSNRPYAQAAMIQLTIAPVPLVMIKETTVGDTDAVDHLFVRRATTSDALEWKQRVEVPVTVMTPNEHPQTSISLTNWNGFPACAYVNSINHLMVLRADDGWGDSWTLDNEILIYNAMAVRSPILLPLSGSKFAVVAVEAAANPPLNDPNHGILFLRHDNCPSGCKNYELTLNDKGLLGGGSVTSLDAVVIQTEAAVDVIAFQFTRSLSLLHYVYLNSFVVETEEIHSTEIYAGNWLPNRRGQFASIADNQGTVMATWYGGINYNFGLNYNGLLFNAATDALATQVPRECAVAPPTMGTGAQSVSVGFVSTTTFDSMNTAASMSGAPTTFPQTSAGSVMGASTSVTSNTNMPASTDDESTMIYVLVGVGIGVFFLIVCVWLGFWCIQRRHRERSVHGDHRASRSSLYRRGSARDISNRSRRHAHGSRMSTASRSSTSRRSFAHRGGATDTAQSQYALVSPLRSYGGMPSESSDNYIALRTVPTMTSVASSATYLNAPSHQYGAPRENTGQYGELSMQRDQKSYINVVLS